MRNPKLAHILVSNYGGTVSTAQFSDGLKRRPLVGLGIPIQQQRVPYQYIIHILFEALWSLSTRLTI